jgi:alpha-N-acetylglucosaminidase
MYLSQSLLWIVSAFVVVAAQSTDGILNLVKRQLPNHVNDFEFHLLGNSTGLLPSAINATNDEYSVSSTSDGKILVEGNSLIALATG